MLVEALTLGLGLGFRFAGNWSDIRKEYVVSIVYRGD